MAAIALWLLLWSPVPYTKYFAITQDTLDRHSNLITPSFAHPKRKQFVPIIADALAACFTPIVCILLINLLGISFSSSYLP